MFIPGSEELHVNMRAIPAPRLTQKSKYYGLGTRYKKWKNALRWEAKQQKFELGDNIQIGFYFSMPKSWSKKKKSQMMGRPHTQTPDLDNLIKSTVDALKSKDSSVYDIRAYKLWSDSDAICIENY